MATKGKKTTAPAVLHYDSERHVGRNTKHGMPLCYYLEHKARSSSHHTDDAEGMPEGWLEYANEQPVTRRRADVACEVCKEHLEFSRACYGCKKPFAIGGGSGDWDVNEIAKLEIVPFVHGVIPREKALTVFVHGIHNRASHNSHAYTAKAECARKAREYAGACPGCGDRAPDGEAATFGRHTATGTRPGELCDDCYALLRRAKTLEAHEAVGLKRYTLPPNLIAPRIEGWRDNDPDKAPDWHLARLLARAACGLGKKPVGDDSESNPLVRDAEHPGIRERGPSVELLPDQAEAMREIARAVQACIEGAYQKGVAEGKSLLFGLASGKVTIGELNEREAKLSVNRKLAPDPEPEDDEESEDDDDES
jgi:hypothetical protein